MRNLQKLGGMAALCEAGIYIAVFVFYGAFWNFPAAASNAEKLAFLSLHQVALSIINLTGYVAFGILLAVLVVAAHERLKEQAETLPKIASVFGVVWVGLVMASGMVATIGIKAVVKLAPSEPEQARSLWLAVNTVVEALGGGNEIVGGLWVLLLSCAALKAKVWPRSLNYLGLAVGTAGILTVYPAEILTEIFGLSQILWFLFLGLFMLRKS